MNYAFKGALSKITTMQFAMMDIADRGEVVRASVLEHGLVGIVMTLPELLRDHPQLLFHRMEDELVLETLRHMVTCGTTVLIQCDDGVGFKFPAGCSK